MKRLTLLTALALLAITACGDSLEIAPPGPDAGAAVSAPSADVTPGMTSPSGSDASDASAGDARRDSETPAGCSGSASAKPGERTETIDLAGTTRTYVVHVPTGYTGKSAVPVVFDFHPLGSNVAQWKLATGWSTLADDKGFIVVWPEGSGGAWNVGRCCDPALAAKIDDVAFVRAIVARLSGEACVDPKKIYASGCSNGGGMAYRLACDAADVIAAVAPVDFDCITGATNSPSCGQCQPSRPISVAQFRGTSDPLAPYAGGFTLAVAGLSFPGAQANFSDWANRNACAGAAAPLANHPACKTYTSCGAGTETTLCTVPNGLHCTDYFSFGTASIAWEMFQRQTMP